MSATPARVLLADDSITIQKVIELTMMDMNVEIQSVGDGTKALALLAKQRFDLVIADVHMPEATGYEVCQRSKQIDPEVPVLLLVGTFEPFDEVRAHACGADSFMKKPFDSRDLLSRVTELLALDKPPTPEASSTASGVPPATPRDAAPKPSRASSERGRTPADDGNVPRPVDESHDERVSTSNDFESAPRSDLPFVHSTPGTEPSPVAPTAVESVHAGAVQPEPDLVEDSIDLDTDPDTDLAADANSIGAVTEPATASILVASVSDLPTNEDHLGFPPYVKALAGFLASDRTHPPLTLSIEGAWGSGKSSFMLQLEKALREGAGLATSSDGQTTVADGPKHARRRPQCLTVQFNAWRHDKEEALWASFALEFIRQVSRQLSIPRRLLGHCQLFVRRYRWWEGWLELGRALAVWLFLAVLCLGLPIALISSHRIGTALQQLGQTWLTQASRIRPDLAAPPATTSLESPPAIEGAGGATHDLGSDHSARPPLAQRVKGLATRAEAAGGRTRRGEAEPDGRSELWLELARWLIGLGAGGAYAAAAISLVLKLKGLVGNPLEIKLRQHMRSPDYEGRLAFIETFQEDFRRIVKAYAAKRKVYVFIDDLDRCEVPKAADLMTALNLLIADDPHLVFIIGMDREKVAAGLALKYEKLLPYLQPRTSAGEPADRSDSRSGMDYGYTFIEKFIQLPFRVPAPGPGDIGRFLCSIAGNQDDSANERKRSAKSPDDSRTAQDAKESGERTPGLQRTGLPASAVPAPEDAPSRRILELLDQDDSEALRQLAMMVAPILGNNPRRLKQFVNLFRLQAYIAAETGGFHEREGRLPLTLEQLAKLVAISLMWPGFLADLADDTGLLRLLEKNALGKLPKKELERVTSRERRWMLQETMKPLLRYGLTKGSLAVADLRRYGLAGLDVDQLLRVAPAVPRPMPASVPRGGESSRLRSE